MTWPHLIAYPLAVLLGTLVGAAALHEGQAPNEPRRLSDAPAATLRSVTGPPPASARGSAAPAPSSAAGSTQAPTHPAANQPPSGVGRPVAATIPGNGTFIVGQQVKPGRYVTVGGEIDCYWARLSDTSGGRGSIRASGNSRGRTTVTIKKSDAAFETAGCAPWTRLSS